MSIEPDTAGTGRVPGLAASSASGSFLGSAALRPVAFALLVLGVVVVAHFSDFRWLAARWLAIGNESHGLLVAALVPYFVWRRRGELFASDRGRGAFLAGLVVLEVAYAYAHAASVDAARFALLPAIALCGIGTALGAPAARTLATSIGVFVFAVPLWDVLTPVLQQLTVEATTLLLSVVGVPAHIVGNMITIPAGTFEVVGGCSGTNYFVVALATAAILALTSRFDVRGALRVAALAVGTALVANWLRVTFIVYVGHATEMTSPLVEQHITFGWFVFAFAMVPLFWYSSRLPSRAVDPAARLPASSPAPAWSMCALGAPFVSAALLAASDARESAPIATHWSVPVPWTRAPLPGDWTPSFPGAVVSEQLAVTNGSDFVELYVAAYAQQQRGLELVGSQSTLAGSEWRETSASMVSAREDTAALVREIVLERDAERRVVWAWYEVRGVRELEPWRVKLREGLTVLGAERRSAIMAMSAACRPDCVAARAVLGRAARDGLADFRVLGTREVGR